MYNYSYNIIYIKVFLLIQIEIIDISQQNTIDWVYSQARCAHYTYEAEANAKSIICIFNKWYFGNERSFKSIPM